MPLITTPIVVAPPVVCGTPGCDGVPEVQVLWPGKESRLACAKCSTTAVNVATGMGFELLLQKVAVRA